MTFCYFPISFRPPPNDPYGITADDLKLALRDCMAASPYFAKLALPLFLEKFTTAAGQSMVSSLTCRSRNHQVAEQCTEGPHVVHGGLFPDIWTSGRSRAW